jgi:hypothetical protein
MPGRSRESEYLSKDMARYIVSGSAGSRDGNRWAVLDIQDKQGGKGMRRVSFHRTGAEAKRVAKQMNEATAPGRSRESGDDPPGYAA